MNKSVRDTRPPFLRFSATTGWPLTDAPEIRNVLTSGTALHLGIEGQRPIALAEPFGSFGGRRIPRGFAINSEGRMFLCDPDTRVVLTALAGEPRPPGTPIDQVYIPLWPARDLPDGGAIPPDPYTLVQPVDVAIAPNGDLVIVDLGAGRILVLAWPTAHLRHVISLPDHWPTALAFAPGGQIYITAVTRDPDSDARDTVLCYDSDWRRNPHFPHSSLQLNTPTHIAAPLLRHCGCVCDDAPDCSCASVAPLPAAIYILDRGGLHAIAPNGRLMPDASLPDHLGPPPLHVNAGGNLAYNDPAFPGHEPIVIPNIPLSGDGRLLGTNLPLIALPRRIEVPRFGSLISAMIDSGTNGFVWDRITLSLTLPENTRLLISTLTSDSPIEPDRVLAQPIERWSEPLEITRDATPEVLVQSVPGRYLWLRVEMLGDGTQTPAINGIDLHGPRRSALDDLPPLFRQDPESAAFVDRFMAYFNTVFDEVSATHTETPALFDPFAVPPEFMDWLGSWFDLEFQSGWSVQTRREMIAEAIPYFRMRGTVAGLKRILQWHTGLTGDLPQVIEHYRLADLPSSPVIGGTELPSANLAHGFTIVLPQISADTPDELARLNRLIAASIPAHTHYNLILIHPGITIGRQSTVGVDTLLGSFDPAPLGTAQLGNDFSTLGPSISGPLPFHANPMRGEPSC